MAEDLHALIGHLGLGPVHLAAQDFSGPLAYRLAATHPQDLLSFTAVETGLLGFGLEILTNPMIAWHFGILAQQGAAERFFKGRETELLNEFIFTPPPTTSKAIAPDDIAEFIRGYARDGGWNGAQVVYNANMREMEEYKSLVAAQPLAMPMLAIDQKGSNFTAQSFTPRIGRQAAVAEHRKHRALYRHGSARCARIGSSRVYRRDRSQELKTGPVQAGLHLHWLKVE